LHVLVRGCELSREIASVACRTFGIVVHAISASRVLPNRLQYESRERLWEKMRIEKLCACGHFAFIKNSTDISFCGFLATSAAKHAYIYTRASAISV